MLLGGCTMFDWFCRTISSKATPSTASHDSHKSRRTSKDTRGIALHARTPIWCGLAARTLLVGLDQTDNSFSTLPKCRCRTCSTLYWETQKGSGASLRFAFGKGVHIAYLARSYYRVLLLRPAPTVEQHPMSRGCRSLKAK